LSIEETNLVLEGLGLLPFARVYEVVDVIQRQAREQIDGSPDRSGTTPGDAEAISAAVNS
jgi:hypothetical protein